MSDTYFYGVGAQSSRIDRGSCLGSESIENVSWFPREYIEWTPDLSNAILSFFVKLDYPFRSYLDIPFEDPLRSEIRRFLVSLDAYIESPNPVIPYKDILYGSTSFDYSKTLKRIKRKSFETTWIVEHYEYPSWWNEVPSYKIKDIGDIFNYSYLIFWKGTSEDYLEGFEPVSIDKDYLALFKEKISEILPDRESFQKIEPMEVLTQLSSSMSLDSDSSHKPHYQIKNKYLYFSKNRGVCDRSVISVSPENYRDSVINNPSDLNTIALIDKQMMEVLRVMPGHIHLTNKEIVTKRLRSFRNSCSYFIQRDLKKEGITKPRQLLKAMLEVLHDAYPDIEIFSYTDFYETYSLRLEDDTIVFPDRGHGLGMANALTTLMQLAIHRMVRSDLFNYTSFTFNKMLCINDDFVAGFDSAEAIFEYWNLEDEIMDKLSIIREPTKSFCSEYCFVLAERYFYAGEEYDKTSYQLRELLFPLTCYNVCHAKEYFISAQSYCNSKYATRYLDEIRNYWGYEFYPSEFTSPYVTGGWINEKVNSVDLSLVILEEIELKSYHFRGFNASKTGINKMKKGDIVKSPIFTLMGEPNIPEEYWNHFDLLSANSLRDKYGRILSRSRTVFSNYWDKIKKIRSKVFKNDASDMTYKDLLIGIKNHYKTTQFYPNDSMIKCYHQCNAIEGRVEDIYLDPNPKLALVSKFNDTSYEFKESFSINFLSADATTKKISSLFSKEVQRSLKSGEVAALMTGSFHEIYYPSDGYKPEEQYLSPVKIGELTAILNWGRGYPEVFEEYEDILIEEKREVFGYLFSILELYLITLHNLSRTIVKSILSLMTALHLDSFTSALLYIEEYVPDEPIEELNYSDDEESSDDEVNVFNLGVDRTSDETKTMVTMEDLFLEGAPILWNINNDSESFIYESLEVKRLALRLTFLINIITHPYLYKRDELIEEDKKIISSTDIVFSTLYKRSGVAKLLSSYVNDEREEDYDTFDLFGDG